jgi:hypothetical protein
MTKLRTTLTIDPENLRAVKIRAARLGEGFPSEEGYDYWAGGTRTTLSGAAREASGRWPNGEATGRRRGSFPAKPGAAVRMKGLAVRRVALPAVTGAVMIGVLTVCNPGGLLGCQPVAPRELPSGAAPGTGIEGVAGGLKQFVWGEGLDRVELLA